MMRRGPAGPRTLCNACGLKWANKVCAILSICLLIFDFFFLSFEKCSSALYIVHFVHSIIIIKKKNSREPLEVILCGFNIVFYLQPQSDI